MAHSRRFELGLPLFLCAALTTAAGCGGSSDAVDGGDGGSIPGVDGSVSLTPADQAFLADFCAAVVPCCTMSGLTANTTVCKQSLAKLSWTRDPQVRAACLDEIRQRASTSACMPDIGDLGGPCSRVFDEPSGMRAPGETCKTAAECAGSPGTITHCFGTCITDALGAAGDYPCLGNVGTTGLINDIPWKANSTVAETHGFLCELRSGLYCDWNDNVCKALLPGGSACTGNQQCASGSCAGPTADAWVCAPMPGLGDACVLDCAGDNYCDNGVCVSKLAGGVACTDSSQCLGDCKGSDRCSGTCGAAGVCSPITVVQQLLQGVWCGLNPVLD